MPIVNSITVLCKYDAALNFLHSAGNISVAIYYHKVLRINNNQNLLFLSEFIEKLNDLCDR
jgi:hypothetical protein